MQRLSQFDLLLNYEQMILHHHIDPLLMSFLSESNTVGDHDIINRMKIKHFYNYKFGL